MHPCLPPPQLSLVHSEGPVKDHSNKKEGKCERENKAGLKLTMFGLAVVGKIFNPSSMTCFRCVQVTKGRKGKRQCQWKTQGKERMARRSERQKKKKKERRIVSKKGQRTTHKLQLIHSQGPCAFSLSLSCKDRV